ncbi:hypothetical protein N5J48_05200 [Acinetobacter ursingii]|uniref:hypothetical protein n=1 Tax=Acinetobacter ursingii TaxID=108980 RepID=UPI002447BACB|nr:hypothetical protein [Acinetobacter ursingii]MDH2126949.1 hypothetical protein [Acinetobacter ursingii]
MKVRLKYLTYCVLGLSLSGCTQHVIKTNSVNQTDRERIISGLNAGGVSKSMLKQSRLNFDKIEKCE